MARCKSCGAEIIWIETPGGKKMPCDPEQVVYKMRKGARAKIVTQNGEVHSADLGVELGQGDGIGYISHWSTCPFAERHRRDRL